MGGSGHIVCPCGRNVLARGVIILLCPPGRKSRSILAQLQRTSRKHSGCQYRSQRRGQQGQTPGLLNVHEIAKTARLEHMIAGVKVAVME